MFMHIPGLYVVMPSTPYDAKGLLKAAIRDDNPVLFIEHKVLYSGVMGPVPDDDYIIPLGVADIKRAGTDATIVAYCRMLHFAMDAAEKLAKEGINVEVIDPRTLNPLDIDTHRQVRPQDRPADHRLRGLPALRSRRARSSGRSWSTSSRTARPASTTSTPSRSSSPARTARSR